MIGPHDDPYNDVAYQEFVESMVPHCHCDERFRPCDGILAGGVCDQIKDERDEPPYDSDDELD